ncbi:hypothetical protein V866_008379 [Kwoniella sp. B9012]
MKPTQTQTHIQTTTSFDPSTLDQLVFKTSQFKSLRFNGPTQILPEGGGSGPFIHPSRQINLSSPNPTRTSINTTQTNLGVTDNSQQTLPLGENDANRLGVLGYDPLQPYFINCQSQNHYSAQHQLPYKIVSSDNASSVSQMTGALSDTSSSKKNKVPIAPASAGLGLTKNQKKKKWRGNGNGSKELRVQVKLSKKLEKKKNELKKKANVPAPTSISENKNMNIDVEDDHPWVKIPGQQLRDQIRAAKRRGLTLEEYLTRKGKIPIGSFDSMSFKEKLEKEKRRNDQLANELTRPNARGDTRLNLLLKMIEHDPEIHDIFKHYTENTSTLEQNAKFRLYKRLGEIVDRF